MAVHPNYSWRFAPAQRRRVAEALKLEGERAEEVLATIERYVAEYRAAAEIESFRSGKERNRERAEYAQQLRRLEAAGQVPGGA